MIFDGIWFWPAKVPIKTADFKDPKDWNIIDNFSEDSAVLTNGEVDISIMKQFEKCHLDQLIVRDKDGILKGE
eukprot:10382619-Lingulodinium_polyedra.AAC.1